MTPTVLLVDDDPNLLHALGRALRRESYTIRVAESAAAAFEVLAQHPVDVVVSDEGMPGMAGTRFLTSVHREYPDTIRIMLTGRASLDVAIQAINEGHVYRFFTKPCSLPELAIALRQALLQRALLFESRRLLCTVRRQSAALAELDPEFHGLTHVQRDESGAIVLSDVPTDLEALLHEVERELTAADAQLRAHEPAFVARDGPGLDARNVAGASGARTSSSR